ncbi:Brix domain-containing protein [Thermogladius sp. 4427co]|uniref:Brix domain-containing protein n=1 Tax=Thermogladius sp. 4427co TaxID=3450718 RepID=UPI003F7A5F62
MFLISSSRRPSQRLRSFLKDLALILPGSVKVTRGKKTISELASLAFLNNAKYIILVENRRGNPSIIRVMKVGLAGDGGIKVEDYVSIRLRGVRLSREGGSRLTYPINGYNGVDYSKCYSEKCLEFSGILMNLLGKFIRENFSYRIVLEENGPVLILKIIDRRGAVVGPLMKIGGFRVYGR